MKIRQSANLQLWLLAAACGAVAACDWRQNPQERVVRLYVDMSPDISNMQPLHPIQAEPSMTPTPTTTPTPKSTPVATATPPPKIKPVAPVKAKPTPFAPLLQFREKLRGRGLIIGDLKDGNSRMQYVEESIAKKNLAGASRELKALEAETLTIKIDEAFISAKNARLLTMIQELKPAAEVQAKIDQESETINQLLEQADYVQINARMNKLFELLD